MGGLVGEQTMEMYMENAMTPLTHAQQQKKHTGFN